ncbi:MAG: hypothetical protein HWE14_14730 [Flavobacteriia bacterium]|nr:hypothetical protein [Flavobacteriia bacterium]
MNNQIRISTRKTPLIGKILLLLIAAGCLLGVTGIVLGVLAFGTGFHIGLLIFIAVLVFLAYWMVRMFLWNSYGAEVFTLGETLTYHADFKYFQTKPVEFKTEELKFEFEPTSQVKVNHPSLDRKDLVELGILKFSDGEKEWQTVLLQEESFMQGVMEKLESKYGLKS